MSIYITWIHPELIMWWLVCQKQVSRAGTSNHIPQYLWDVITCPCPTNLLLTHMFTYTLFVKHNSIWEYQWCSWLMCGKLTYILDIYAMLIVCIDFHQRPPDEMKICQSKYSIAISIASIAECKTVLFPLPMHWAYSNCILSHHYAISTFQKLIILSELSTQ